MNLEAIVKQILQFSVSLCLFLYLIYFKSIYLKSSVSNNTLFAYLQISMR